MEASTSKKEFRFGSYIKCIFRDTFRSIKDNSLMSVASVLSIVAALIILGIFVIFSANLDQITNNMEAEMELKVFLKHEITEEQRTKLEQDLLNYSEISGVTYESADEALQNFSESLEDYSGLLSGYNSSNNPMQASYSVQVHNAENIKAIKGYIEKLSDDGVDYVKYGEEYVDALIKFSQYSNIFCIVMLVILTVVSMFIIYNTIKLTCFARRREIRVMRYVGASDWYIRAPFVLEGMILGCLGAIIAMLIIRSGYYFILSYVEHSVYIPMNSSLVDPSVLMGPLTIFCVLYGIIIGSLGSLISMRKFLDA